MKNKSYEEMHAMMIATFGEDADLTYESGTGWVINTNVLENVEAFDWEQYKDTPAWKAHDTPEASYGSDLERWGYKNGHGYSSMKETVEAYNARMAQDVVDAVNTAKGYLDRQGSDYEGLTDQEIWDKATVVLVKKT